MAGAEPEFNGPDGNGTVAVGVDDGEFARRKLKGDGLGGIPREMEALETNEGTNGSAGDAGVRDVEFGDLVAGDGRSVGDFGGCGYRFVTGKRPRRAPSLRRLPSGWWVFARGRKRRVGVGKGGIRKAEAEGKEGIFGEIAVSAVEHGIVGERRKLPDGSVESDGETPRRIVVSGENVGDGVATFFARIPGFEDGGRVFAGPVHSESAACGENDDERFAGRDEGLEEVFLRAGKVDVGAVAAKETGIAVVLLFAFKVGGDTNNSDYDIRFASGIDGFLSEVGRNPEKTREGFAEAAEIFKLDGIGVTGLEMDERAECAFAALAVDNPVIKKDFAIEQETETAIGTGSDAVVAFDRCDELAGPANGVVFDRNAGGGRDVVPDEVESRIDAGDKGSAGKGGIVEVFRGEARL